MNIKSRVAAAAMAAACLAPLAVAAGVAEAGSGNVTLQNGCNVYWQNSWGNGQGSSYTIENSNCAALEAKMHADLAGSAGWVTVTSGYVNGSYSAVARYVDQKPAYSDHNGKNTTNGTAYGFRKSY